MITAIILTKNEEKNVERAIHSVSFCNEVLIVDDGSTDQTVQIAQKLGCKILKHLSNQDFSSQRNYAMEKATEDWVLFIDADEEVTEELRENILKTTVINENDVRAHSLRRRDFFWGSELKYGETRKARAEGIIRLMKKNSGVWQGRVHETFEVANCSVGTLDGFINHYPHQTVKDFLSEVNEYSTIRAKSLDDDKKRFSLLSLVLVPFGKFILTYFIYRGFLDGPSGFAYSFFLSFHSFLVRAKLFQYTKLNKRQYKSVGGERGRVPDSAQPRRMAGSTGGKDNSRQNLPTNIST